MPRTMQFGKLPPVPNDRSRRAARARAGRTSQPRLRARPSRYSLTATSKRLQEWLDRIAEENGPLAAFRCFTDLLEYHVPKLARTELTGNAQAPLALAAISMTPEEYRRIAARGRGRDSDAHPRG